MKSFFEEEGAKRIVEKIRSAGYEAYYAGGAVRDCLLGRVPKDYDVVTNALPEEILELYPKANVIGKHFGVLLIKSKGELYEVATFRKDGEYSDKRRPEAVEFTDAETDAQRRDFTINGMFYDPVECKVIDYVGGQRDLKACKIRAIGEPSQRFSEDALRLLRAVRFAVVTGFEIDPLTYNAIQENAHLLQYISVERIQEEFSKIMCHSRRASGLELLMDTGLMRYIIPEVMDLVGCEQPPQWHPEGDVYQHTKLALDLLSENSPLSLCLAVLLHDIGKPATYTYDDKDQRIRFNGHDQVGAQMSVQILTRLRYSNSIIQVVEVMVEHHMQFMNVQKMREAKVKRFLARPTMELELELHRVDCASSNGFTENYEFLRAKQKEYANAPIIPKPFITGRDLIAYGLQPGPEFKAILEEIQTEQLEGRIKSAQGAMEYLRQMKLKKN